MADAPIDKLVNLILLDSIKRGASEIQVEPEAERLVVSFRIDGVLRQAMEPPVALARALVSRFKHIAGLEGAEHARHQAGQFQIRVGSGETFDFGVFITPVPFGERVVVRRPEHPSGLLPN